jgi:hypothetical protein
LCEVLGKNETLTQQLELAQRAEVELRQSVETTSKQLRQIREQHDDMIRLNNELREVPKILRKEANEEAIKRNIETIRMENREAKLRELELRNELF